MKRQWAFSGVVAAIAILASGAIAQDSPSPNKEYQHLVKEFDDQREGFFKAYREAKTDEERQKLKYPDAKDYSKKFFALAERHPKDPVAADALVWIVLNDGYNRDVAPKAMALLAENHIKSDKLDDVCGRLTWSQFDEAETLLRKALTENPHRNVQAAAHLSYGRFLKGKGKSTEAEKYFNQAIEKYGDVKRGDRTVGDEAKGDLFELHNLAIGKVAPEIEGEDVDGKRFKLSDFRGKVVVLDFWGDW